MHDSPLRENNNLDLIRGDRIPVELKGDQVAGELHLLKIMT
jgi:hypothetical protein